jgi:DNA-binding response OmpR family regulator
MTEPRSLLLVDDDDSVAAAVARLFEREGWRVHRARSGNEAAALARGSETYHPAVVDLVLPGVGGLDVVRELRAHHPRCRIVGMTGLGESAMVDAFRKAGADAFVGKPFELEALVKAIEP